MQISIQLNIFVKYFLLLGENTIFKNISNVKNVTQRYSTASRKTIGFVSISFSRTVSRDVLVPGCSVSRNMMWDSMQNEIMDAMRTANDVNANI